MTEAVIKKESQTIKVLKLLLKIAVTVLCFWYISRKIDFTKAKDAVMQADWWWLSLSVVAFAFSKFLASFRLNIYFKNIGIYLSQKKNLKLYWLGMFYNLFLPGAISGDAYKVVLLNRKYKTPYKKASAAVLLDRFSGVLALGVILCIYGIVVLDRAYFDVLLIAGAILAIIGFYLAIR